MSDPRFTIGIAIGFCFAVMGGLGYSQYGLSGAISFMVAPIIGVAIANIIIVIAEEL